MPRGRAVFWGFLLLSVPVWAQSSGHHRFSTKIGDDFCLQNLSSKGHRFLGYATVTQGAAVSVKKLVDDAPGPAIDAHNILGTALMGLAIILEG